MWRHTARIKAKRICLGTIAIALVFALNNHSSLVIAAELSVAVIDKDGNPATNAVVF